MSEYQLVPHPEELSRGHHVCTACGMQEYVIVTLVHAVSHDCHMYNGTKELLLYWHMIIWSDYICSVLISGLDTSLHMYVSLPLPSSPY